MATLFDPICIIGDFVVGCHLAVDTIYDIEGTLSAKKQPVARNDDTRRKR